MARHRRRGVAACAALLLVALSACGGSTSDGGASGEAGSTEGDSAGAARVEVTIQGFAFEPSEIEVEAGTVVSFVNADSADHTATSDGDGDDAFDTEVIGEGESVEVTFDEPGEHPYHCAIHEYMKGNVVVVE